MTTVTRIVRSIRRLTDSSTDTDPPIKRRLRERANSDAPMDEQLLADGFAELGDVVQAYCDHPPALQDEYFDGDFLHRSCQCGAYLGLVEDQ